MAGPRSFTFRVWRQCSPGPAAAPRSLLAVDDPAVYPGRYHRKGESATWYSSLTRDGAWAELFRHTKGGIDPAQIRRRIGRVSAKKLQVLDLADPAVRRQIGVTKRELEANSWLRCQSIAHDARQHGLDGLLTPSAALPGATSLVVFSVAMSRLFEGTSSIRQAPPRMRRRGRHVPRARGHW